MYVRPIKVDNLLMKKFIKDRWNKDNLWNLVFFFGVILSVAIAEIIAKSIALILIIPSTIFAFVLSSYFLSKLMKQKQSNKKLKKGKFIWGQTLFFVSIMLVAFIFFPFFLLEGVIISELIMCNIFVWLLIIPSTYCIYKNLPIKFYFKKNAWHRNQTYSSSSNGYRHESLLSTNQLINNPMNSWYSGNRFHHRK
jgi:hypothetical protein